MSFGDQGVRNLNNIIIFQFRRRINGKFILPDDNKAYCQNLNIFLMIL